MRARLHYSTHSFLFSRVCFVPLVGMETVEPLPSNGKRHANVLEDEVEAGNEIILALEQANKEHGHRRKKATIEREKAKHHAPSVRRSERIKSAAVPSGNLKCGSDYIVDLTNSGSENDEPDTPKKLSEKSLHEKVNYALQRIENLEKNVELLRSKVDGNNSAHEAPFVPCISYKSINLDSQKKLPVQEHNSEAPLWSSKITSSMAIGNQCLVIPRKVRCSRLSNNPEKITVKLPNKMTEKWKLVWNPSRPKQCQIGQGWYNFCRKSEFKFGDILHFWETNKAHTFKLTIERA